MKFILILYIIVAQTSEQMPEWYDTKADCKQAAVTAIDSRKGIDYICIPVEYQWIRSLYVLPGITQVI